MPDWQALLDLDVPPARTRIVVAMSGGVDSSVVAASLARAGYEVVGITLQLYDQGAKIGVCCAGQDTYDAKSVADWFGFPHYVHDYKSHFNHSVLENFGLWNGLSSHGQQPVENCSKRSLFISRVGPIFLRALVLSLRDGRPSVWIGPSFLGRIVLQQLWKSLKSSRVPSGVFWKFRRIT